MSVLRVHDLEVPDIPGGLGGGIPTKRGIRAQPRYQIKWQGSLILTERTKSKVTFEHNQWSVRGGVEVRQDGSVDNSFMEEPLRAARLCYLAITSVLYPRPPRRGRRAAQVRLLAVTTDNSSTVCCSPGSLVSRVQSRGSVLSLL
ncbi:hypothetical protein J6590_058580 [Homalodisca vitripennis]|nr:hypothetical protein J6590_058580 [Homalodisca vitripennis]